MKITDDSIYDSAKRGLVALEELRGIFQYRDLIFQLVRRDIVARYKRSILGFAASTTWEPGILILDEVLSVGDEAFRKKCETRMKGFRTGGTTSIMVSHSMDSIMSLCTRAAWLDHGTVRLVGPAKEVVAAYRQAQAGV